MEQIPKFASYRDPDSWIHSTGDEVVREFSPDGARAFLAAHEDGVLRDLIEQGLLIGYELHGSEALRVSSPRLPFVSYPDEWTFEMLREAALLTLEVSRRLWASGFHLKDASAYNVVFDATTPRFVDLGSIGLGRTPLWGAYGQFCDHFLNPLLIEAKTGLSFRHLWTLEGVPVDTARRILHGSKAVGSGAFRNVVLRGRLESSLQDAEAATRRAARSELALPSTRTYRLMEKMGELVESLSIGGGSRWLGYTDGNSYDETEEKVRDELVRAFGEGAPGGVALDVGTNSGRHAAVLAPSQRHVIGLDSDSSAIEAARSRFVSEGIEGKVYPVVADIADPSPGRGLLNQERAPLLERLDSLTSVTWMAVIHHLVIGRSIPMDSLAQLASRLAPRHLIEFVDINDPMAQLLAASKADRHHPYDLGTFQKSFGAYFKLERLGQTLETRPVFELNRLPDPAPSHSEGAMGERTGVLL